MNNKAMALVEIVVSMLILAVAALGVASTISLVNSNQMRSAGGSSLDLQAASFARQTLEELKNSVSTNTAGNGARLVDNSYTAPCATAAGSPCGGGTTRVSALSNPAVAGEVLDTANLALPVGSDLATHGAIRKYTVWDISGGGGTVAYKRVTATVDRWTD